MWLGLKVTAQRCGIVRVIGNYTIAAGGLAHVMAWGQGVFDCRNKTITVSGSATGKRYDIVTNAVIQTAGAGVNLLPGNSAGTTATGGQYA
ncbi:MAG: hypothetical protein HS113_20455 [Verrucomicrobiales bacterium]|nr:hypothetical protein [Verrucomicrobiales bacterium]